MNEMTHLSNVFVSCLYRVAQKEFNTYDQRCHENEGQNKQDDFVSIIAYTILFLQDDTKIINFDEGVSILWPFFWGNVIFKICHCLFKSHNWLTEKFNCLASPGKCLLLLCKTKTAWIKRSHSLRNSAVLQSGEGTQRNSSLPQSWLFDTKEAKFENDIGSEQMALESKRLH